MRFNFYAIQPIKLIDRGLKIMLGLVLVGGGLLVMVLTALFLKALWFG